MTQASRTLRSARKRALIFRSQHGICGICGEEMQPDSDWEIDHANPWRITRRTNPYEMQAVHRRCNRRKGGRVAFEIKHEDLLRKGQRDAIEMIEGRVRRGTETTAIVLPCRYGKSDVIRLAAVKLWAQGQACVSLGVSPGEILRDQLGEATRWSAAFKRYGVITKNEPQIATIDKPKAGIRCKFNPNGEAFLSVTTQLVQQNLGEFADWIESEVNRTGLPVLVFVDECHSGSDENEWGAMVPVLAKAGAHVVLLTATPERADHARIPGFEFDAIEEGDVTLWRTRPHQDQPELVTVEQLQGKKVKLKLRPDLEVTFDEAWKEETDGEPILCKISRTTYDARLSSIGDGSATWLSEIDSPEKVKSILGKVVREPLVIRDGCRRLVEALGFRRAFHPDFQAIIYCGNDIETGNAREENKHPKAIRAALHELDSSLTTVIATRATDGREIIQRFASGHGDVLIVKQMAGMGLDLPWVKVGLDLSSTRTYPGLVQRLFRPATPHLGAVACEWITVDDIVSAAYFDRLVTQQGGEARATDLEIVRSYDKKRKEGPDGPGALSVDDVKDGRFDDSAGRNGKPEQWEIVAELMTRYPKLTTIYTHAEIGELAVSLHGDQPAPAPSEEAPAAVRDTSISADALRAEINSLAKDATINYLRDRQISHKGGFGMAIELVFRQAKTASDWPVGTELGKLDDLDALKRLRDAMHKLSRTAWLSE